ncbi:MAG: hypothetical protein ACJAT4_003379 [Granulosicoccus sp.]
MDLGNTLISTPDVHRIDSVKNRNYSAGCIAMRCRIINAAFFYQWEWRYAPITILSTRLFHAGRRIAPFPLVEIIIKSNRSA